MENPPILEIDITCYTGKFSGEAMELIRGVEEKVVADPKVIESKGISRQRQMCIRDSIYRRDQSSASVCIRPISHR